MRGLSRCVEPEVLDSLDREDPTAIRARRDLRRVHRAMGSLSILKRTLTALPIAGRPCRIIEMGAGDGSLMLRLARALGSRWTNVDLTLLDRIDVVEEETLRAYQKLGWIVRVLCEDVFSWIEEPPRATYDLCIANLFLHHFREPDLVRLLKAVGSRVDTFVACEPRRNRFSRLSSSCVGLIGANAVTREDAVKSVDAGFMDHELTELWPGPAGAWSVQEHGAFPFTHCFTAMRKGRAG